MTLTLQPTRPLPLLLLLFHLCLLLPFLIPSQLSRPTKANESNVWVQYVGSDADGNDTYVLTSTSEDCVTLTTAEVGEAVRATRVFNESSQPEVQSHITKVELTSVETHLLTA